MEDGQLIPPERLYTLAEQLRDSWLAQVEPRVRAVDLAQPQRLYGVHALAAHVHALAPAAVGLFRDDHMLAAIPLVRVMYECALTAQWIQLRPDAANAFLNEDIRNRKAVARTLTNAASRVFQEGEVAGTDFEGLDTSAAGPARHFGQLCDDIVPGGADAYIYYRLMSWFVHPSISLVDHYLDPREGDEFPVMLKEPMPARGAVYLYLAVCSMVWSGRAVDVFDPDHTRRSQLRQVARELGIRDLMRLSSTAEQQVESFERDLRRSKRRGKRAKRKPEGSSDSVPS